MGKWGERVEKKCAGCGRSFYVLPNAKAQKQKYCSMACAGTEKRGEVVCAGCGVTFVPKGSDRNKYCSRECAFSHKSAKAREKKERLAQEREAKRDRICACCGKPFNAQSGVYCSDECRKKVARQKWHSIKAPVLARMRERYQPAPEVVRLCVVCGKEFKTNRRKTCSAKCSRKLDLKGDHRKRARKYGVAYEPVSPINVFNRDGWVCQICGRKTPKSKRGTMADNAPELDHRVPVSLGGGHTYSNVQCACRKCNGTKGNHNSAGQMNFFNDFNYIPGGH